MSNPLILKYNLVDNNFISLPIYDYTNLSVIWDTEGGNNNVKTHMFSTSGIKNIRIYGNIKTLNCSMDASPLSSVNYLTECVHFGDVGLTSISFKNAKNLKKIPQTTPSTLIYEIELDTTPYVPPYVPVIQPVKPREMYPIHRTVTPTIPKMKMLTSLFSDNARVYYKQNSLAPGGVGSVGNYRIKSKKT